VLLFNLKFGEQDRFSILMLPGAFFLFIQYNARGPRILCRIGRWLWDLVCIESQIDCLAGSPKIAAQVPRQVTCRVAFGFANVRVLARKLEDVLFPFEPFGIR
jgi:hypothetical protein